jgi:hypothetical protein
MFLPVWSGYDLLQVYRRCIRILGTLSRPGRRMTKDNKVYKYTSPTGIINEHGVKFSTVGGRHVKEKYVTCNNIRAWMTNA